MRKKRAKIGLTWTVLGFFGSNCSLSSLTVGSSAGGGGGARFSFFDLFSLEDFFSLFSFRSDAFGGMIGRLRGLDSVEIGEEMPR